MARMTVKNQGELLQFLSAGDANISSCKVYFSPKQSGEGTPSPENVRPIEGWSGVEVTHCGKNLLPDNGWNNGYYLNAKGVMKESDLLKISPYLSLLPDIYHFSGTNGSKEIITTSFHAYDENKQWLRRFAYVTANPSETYDFTFTIPNDAKYIAISTVNELINGQLEIGEITTNFEPYQSHAEKELPSEYQKVEYIESTGTQWIELPFGFLDTDEVEIKGAELTRGGDKYLVSPSVWNNHNNRFAMAGGLYKKFRAGFGNWGTAIKMSPDVDSDTLVHIWTYKNRKFSIDNGWSTLDVSNAAFSEESKNLKLFYGYLSPSVGQIYYYHHKKADDTEANLIPCLRRSDSKPGMYDTVSQTFYVNQGTGEFIAGPAVNRYDIDWSEDLGTIYGGYVDLVSGELVEEFAKVTLDGSFSPGIFPWQSEVVEDDTGETLVKALYLKRDTAQNWRNRNIYLTAVCDKLPCMSNYNIKQRSCSFYDGDSYSICLALPKSLVGTTATELNQYLSENPITTSFRLNAPITHQLSPAILTTLTGSNTFWSNADYIEIEYDLIETQEIMDVRKRIIGSFPHLETSEGQFNTDMAAPLKSCRISFSPIQEGEGDPSPSNVRPIRGWDGITVKRCGKNLWSFGDQTFTRYKEILFNEPLPKGIYTFSARVHSEDIDNTRSMVWLCYYNKGARPQNGKHIERSDSERTSVTFDFTEYAPNRIRLYASTSLGDSIDDLVSYTDIQLELGSTASEYEPYTETSITIPFPQTIYGGYVDLVKGEIVETWHQWIEDGSRTPRYWIWKQDETNHCYTALFNALPLQYRQANWGSMGFGKIISPNRKTHDLYVVVEPDTVAAYRSNGLSFGYSFTGEQFENMTKEELTSYISENPIEVVYMLDTPITYSISPQTLRALRGLNNVFSDANGSVELTYWTH